MRFLAILVVYQIAILNLIAQDSLSVDLLREIQSPAANLLGISPTDIASPSDPSSFMVSLRQASNQLSSVPTNYAVDIAPFWMFGSRNIDSNKFLSNEVKNNIPQSFVLSAAVNNDNVDNQAESIENTALGFGIKFSLLRGDLSDNSKSDIEYIQNLLEERGEETAMLIQVERSTNQEWIDLNEEWLNVTDSISLEVINLLKLRERLLLAQTQQKIEDHFNELDKKILAASSKLNVTRTGFKLDFNLASRFDFKDQVVENSELTSIAAWITASLESKKGLEILGIVRYLYNPNQNFINTEMMNSEADLSLLHSGLRLVYRRDKLSLSLESILETAINDVSIENRYKYVFNTEYKITDNLKLSLSLGRDFDGFITKEGNVISALSFLVGLGNNRPILD